jgi:outer membrane protein assembly factor BamB
MTSMADRTFWGVTWLVVKFPWRALGAPVLSVLLAACWPMPGAGPDRRSSNPFEAILTPATVGGMGEVFRAPLPDGAGAPVVTSAGLFVRTGTAVAAFEPDTGARRWSREAVDANGPFTSDPYVLDGGGVVATTYLEAEVGWFDVIVLDAGTGDERLRGSASGGLTSLRGTDMATITPEPTRPGLVPLLALATVGRGRHWGGVAPEIRGGTASLAADGQLYVGTGDQVQRYDATTPCPVSQPGGDVQVCVSEWARPLGGAASPVVIGDDGTVYAGSSSGIVHALRTDTGGIRWTARIGSPVTDTPALAGGVLYVASGDGRLHAFAADGCDAYLCPALWTTAAGSEVTVQPAVAGGVVYVGSADGSLRAFDAAGCGTATCPPLWTGDAGASVDGGLAVFGGRLYAATSDALVSYGLPAG